MSILSSRARVNVQIFQPTMEAFEGVENDENSLWSDTELLSSFEWEELLQKQKSSGTHKCSVWMLYGNSEWNLEKVCTIIQCRFTYFTSSDPCKAFTTSNFQEIEKTFHFKSWSRSEAIQGASNKRDENFFSHFHFSDDFVISFQMKLHPTFTLVRSSELIVILSSSWAFSSHFFRFKRIFLRIKFIM